MKLQLQRADDQVTGRELTNKTADCFRAGMKGGMSRWGTRVFAFHKNEILKKLKNFNSFKAKLTDFLRSIKISEDFPKCLNISQNVSKCLKMSQNF